jgi:hypothetical protein
MSDLQKKIKLTRKNFLNLFFFLISIIIVTAIWPHEPEDNWLNYLGSFMIVSFSYLILYLFLSHFRTDVLLVTRKTIFIIITILSFLALTRFFNDYSERNFLLLIPFAVIPVIIRTFYDARLALFILLITLMLAGFQVEEPFEFVVMNFLTGMVAIYTLTNIYRKGKLFITSFLVTLSYILFYFAVHLLQDGNFTGIGGSDLLLFLANGVLVLLSYPVIFMFEQKFLFLSETTLLELADTNQPLLRKLAEEAPGSFQHSLQVANLAEEAARVTGANLLLVRAGALYHDIGKVANPDHFIENQKSGDNPHKTLNPRESAKVIINHVKSGVVLAKNFKVPVQIIDFIRTHHGTSVAYFFYKMYTDQQPWDTGSENEFTYPGPKPFSKETAIVMMADAVEASSRSMGKITEESIGELVERIVYLQEQDEQFSDVPLTFKDISDIKATFKKRLLTIHHVRIAYPDRDS